MNKRLLLFTTTAVALMVVLFIFGISSYYAEVVSPTQQAIATAEAEKIKQTATAARLISLTLTHAPTPTFMPTFTIAPSETPFSLITPIGIFTPPPTPYPNQTLQAAFVEIDAQFQNLLKGDIAFNSPTQMKKDETTTIQLLIRTTINSQLLETQVVSPATQLVGDGGFVTSTADPNVLIAPNGETVTVTTSQIEITPRMKAVLLPQDSEAFTVAEMHDNAEQVVSTVETTAWRWSVTAKKEGSQTLELVIYQLVKYDGKEFWHEVETYKANILVEVTAADWLKSLDWKWILAFIVTLVGAIIGVWKWLDERKKKPGVMQVKIVDEKKSPPKRKK